MAAVLGLLMLSTLNGIAVAILRRGFFLERFPGATAPVVFVAYLICGLLILVGLMGVWFWKQWGVILLCVLTGLVFVLDLLAHAPMFHIVAGPAALAIVLLAIQPVRTRFRAPAGSGDLK
jgi:uncharacterized membrane protein (DUF2068 family)